MCLELPDKRPEMTVGVYSTEIVPEDLGVGGKVQGTPEQEGSGDRAWAFSPECGGQRGSRERAEYDRQE